MSRQGTYPVEGIQTVRWKNKRAHYWKPGRGTAKEESLKRYWKRLPDDLSSFDFSTLDVELARLSRQKLIDYIVARLSYYKKRARAKEIDFDLTPTSIIAMFDAQGGRCAVSGLNMGLPVCPSSRPYAISVDRIDCARGYVADNIRLVCRIVNLAMSDWGVRPLEVLAGAMLRRDL